MNIFVLDKDPRKAAQFHNDKHCVKMILEHCQLLSSAVNILSSNTIEGVYKTTHINHPCSKWVRESRGNYQWLIEATEELFQEYTKRYGKHHKSYTIFQKLMSLKELVPEGDLTSFAQAMPEEYKNSDPVKAYRTYYLKDKKEISKWKLGNTPEWWE
jgi:hypothetical protein